MGLRVGYPETWSISLYLMTGLLRMNTTATLSGAGSEGKRVFNGRNIRCFLEFRRHDYREVLELGRWNTVEASSWDYSVMFTSSCGYMKGLNDARRLCRNCWSCVLWKTL